MGNLTPREMEKLLTPMINGQVEVLVKPDPYTTTLARGEIESATASSDNQHLIIRLRWYAIFIDEPGSTVAWKLQERKEILLYPETTEFYDRPSQTLKAKQAKETFSFVPAHSSNVIRPPTLA